VSLVRVRGDALDAPPGKKRVPLLCPRVAGGDRVLGILVGGVPEGIGRVTCRPAAGFTLPVTHLRRWMIRETPEGLHLYLYLLIYVRRSSVLKGPPSGF